MSENDFQTTDNGEIDSQIDNNGGLSDTNDTLIDENLPCEDSQGEVVESGEAPKKKSLKEKFTKENIKKYGKAFAKKELPNGLCVLLSALLYVVGVELFVADNGFVTGGVWGIALMIEHVTGVTASYIMFALNIPLLILSVIFLGWKFTIYTFVFIGGQTLFSNLIDLFEISKPLFTGDAQQLLSAIVAGAIMGVGLAICLRFGGCTGGTDIVSVILQKKKLPVSVPWIIFSINSVIIASSYFVFGKLESIAYSIILEFVASKVCDSILSGSKGAVRFEIITDKGEELRDAIINKMDRGATIIEAKGGYTMDNKSIIICIVHKRRTADFKKFLTGVDPNAFINIAKVSSVMGKGFRSDND